MENIKNEGNILKYKKVRKIIFTKDSETDNRTINGGYRRQWNKIYKMLRKRTSCHARTVISAKILLTKQSIIVIFQANKEVSVIKNTLKISERRNMFRVAASEIQKEW